MQLKAASGSFRLVGHGKIPQCFETIQASFVSDGIACNFKKQLKLTHRTWLHNTPGATQLILYVGRGGVSGISINYEHQACQIHNLNIFFFNFKLSALKGMERGTNNI